MRPNTPDPRRRTPLSWEVLLFSFYCLVVLPSFPSFCVVLPSFPSFGWSSFSPLLSWAVLLGCLLLLLWVVLLFSSLLLGGAARSPPSLAKSKPSSTTQLKRGEKQFHPKRRRKATPPNRRRKNSNTSQLRGVRLRGSGVIRGPPLKKW